MKILLVVIIGLFGAVSAFGQNNDFLTDYSLLVETEGEGVNPLVKARYIPERQIQKWADYNSILIDQPEIFIAADSKYKGAKGDQLKLLADSARLAVIEQLEAGGYTVAHEPGPDVLYFRWAITDLYLKKKKRGLLSYTPLGMVVHTTRQAAIRDLWKKIDIVEFAVETELSDFVSGEILGAAISRRQGKRKVKGQEQDLVTWQELDALFLSVGERLVCALNNSKKPQSEWADCGAVYVEAETS